MLKRGRRWLALGLLLFAGAAGWGGWLAIRPDDRWEPTSASTPTPTSSPNSVSPLAVVPRAGGSLAAQGTVASAPMAGDASADPEKESVELCGFGRVTRQQVESWNPVEWVKLASYKNSLDQRKDAALSRLSARLAAGSDRERVAARLLMGDTEGAALIAVSTQDAQAYRLALLSCGTATLAPSCKSLSPHGWANVSPDDAGPWLQLLAEAVSEHNEAAAIEAVGQALQRRNLGPSRPLLRLAHGASAAVDDEVAFGLAVVEIVGRDAALPDVGPYAALRFCSKTAVADGTRRASCERLARWQFEQADSLIDGMVALAIADRIGLPDDQRPFTREQLTRGQTALIDAMPVGSDCRSLTSIAAWPARFSQQSELQMALQAAEAGPEGKARNQLP